MYLFHLFCNSHVLAGHLEGTFAFLVCKGRSLLHAWAIAHNTHNATASDPLGAKAKVCLC